MAKLGGTYHLKRIAAPKAIPISNKKEYTWMKNPAPGPHSKKECVPLIVLLRDVLKVAQTAGEIRKVLAARKIFVDGKVRTDEAFPVGMMDVISFADKTYRIVVDHKTRLVPVEISKTDSQKKIMKVTGKSVLKGKKISVMFHDGRTMLSDNNVRVGDSVVLQVPSFKMEKLLKLEKGAICLIREGKHAGTVAKLEEIIQRKEGKDPEARLSGADGEFITVAKYLFVVDDSFKGAS